MRAFTTNAGTIVWSLNSLDASGGQTYVTFPQPGTGENQYSGARYNFLYAEVCFDVSLANNVDPTTPIDLLRLMVLKKRDPTVTYTYQNIYIHGTAKHNSPLKSKNFDIQCDKTYSMLTGSTTTGVADVNNYTSIYPKIKRFRIIVPMRHTMEQTALNTQNAFPYDVIIIISPAYIDNNAWVINNICAVYYFRDP